MPVDPFAVLQALLRAEASRSQRADRLASEPATPAPEPAPAPEPSTHRDDPTR
ncbi:hypothetical protein [Streptomyces sp. NPDC059247]|uniref:hypothetical protein n=1 Tax=Streptomyces sp. NPDC059247 TaxID=3346790 RepID=UPI00369EBA8B